MRLRVLLVLLTFTACSGDPTIAPRRDADPPSDAGPDGGALDAPAADASPFDAGPVDAVPLADVVMDPLGPDNVSVLDPDDDEVIIDERYTVRCHAEADVSTLSPVTEVTFEVIDSTGLTIAAIGTPEGSDNYSANVNLVNMTNGVLTVRCVATAADGRQAGDDNLAFVDMGPRVTVLSPGEGSFVHGTIAVSFLVTPFPVEPGDTGAAVAGGGVDAQIAGRTITLTVMGTQYTADVSTDDPVVFPIPIVGPAQFQVTATNSRGATREVITTFTVDDTPPSITIDSPAPGELVGGVITVHATIEDPAGVNPDTVVAVFGNGAVAIASFPLFSTATEGVFAGAYDSRELRDAVTGILVFPTLSVRAADLVGNEGNAAEVVIMDYTPPLASLDAPSLRESKEAEGGGLICSWLFDPLGDDATNDGQAIAQLSEFRARVEDRSNEALSTSGTVIFSAGVNEATVQLLVLDETDETVLPTGDALLVDTNDDGVCDEVNPLLNPTTIPMTSSDALAIDLVGLDPDGEALYIPDEDCDIVTGVCTSFYAPDYPTCSAPAVSVVNIPSRLCPPTGLQRIIKPEYGAGRVVFGIPPATPLTCLGLPFDSVANNIDDGWACVAVRVEDNLGNVGVSKPIRVCIDHDGDGLEGCPALPQYPVGVDVTLNRYDVPVVPTMNPPIDCTGTYFSASGTVDAADDCTMPDEDFQFPLAGELRRSDL